MSDFHQEGIVTTLHSLYEAFDREEYLTNLERKLEEYSTHLRISLLLPSLHSEILNPPVLDRIIDEIQKVHYLHSVVVALGGAPDEAQFKEAKEYFGRLRTPERDVKVIWVDGPRIQQIFEEIQGRDISTGVQGKGQSVWVTLGYLFAREDSDVVALHDCDIVTYDRVLLGRLTEPTANPNNDFEFCKGYYARISPSERAMKGRVTRLFVTPFVDAMSRIMRERGLEELRRFFTYHRTFNYPLAGEFSFLTRLARGINIAYDWGLEVSTLSEVYHRVIPQKIAQIDLAQNYEHKHQEISPEDADRGLHRMVVDIAKFYLNYVRSHGFPLDDATVDMILHSYYDNALLFIKSYSDDAEVNDLAYDHYQEELMVQYFRGFLWTAWEQTKGPYESTLIPSWNRVIYSLPGIYPQILEAVEADNAGS
jgi:glucosyl-3-phosphoglycerate synthase